MAKSPRTRPELKPLKVSCDHADCEQGLHCFRESKKLAKKYGQHESGACQHCGTKLVDWERVKNRDPADTAHTFDALKNEWIRHWYWHLDFDPWARNYAIRKGRSGLREAAAKRIRSAVGKAKHPREGQQTGWDKNPLFYAQHATACCCRRCIQYWHGVPEGRPLTEEQVAYFTDLCLRYIFERMPDLAEEGRYVPPIRKEDLMNEQDGDRKKGEIK